jgi:hypothetical protein
MNNVTTHRYIFFVIIFVLNGTTCFSQVIYEDKATELGLIHSMNNADFWGAGVSVFDIDKDGWDDITFATEDDSILIYRNNEGQFELMPFVFYSAGLVKSQLWVDYDNDGDNDFIISSRNGKIKLYKQESPWQFVEVLLPLSLTEIDTPNYGLSFADYDLDGYLDLYISRYYFMPNAIENPSIINLLLRNQGDGTFEDVTYAAGVQNGVKPSFLGGWVDINHDMYPDLYVINDRTVANNTMYLNNGDGTFTDITESSGTLLAQDEPMSLTFEDFNNDGLLDIFCSNSGTGPKLPRLLVNQGDNTFLEQAQQFGILMNEWSWGSTWVDVNNDTYLDLYISTGVISSLNGLDVRSYLYMNNNGISFDDSPEMFDGNHIAPSFSVAKGDFNNDGFQDLVVQNTKEVNSFVWMNQSTLNGANNFIKVTLNGTVSNSMAIGAWINLYADGNRFVHYTRCGENYGSQNTQHHQFGLGGIFMIDSIVVEYPSGIIDKYFNLDVNTHYFFYESETFIFPILYSGSLITCDTNSVVLDGGDYVSYNWNNGYSERYLTPTESGYYWLQAGSSNGLIYRSDTVYVNLILPPDYNYSLTHVSCFGGDDGAVTVELSDLNLGSTVSWSNGQNGMQVTDLAAAEYIFTYSDFYDCNFSRTVEILEPDQLSFIVNQEYDGEFWNLSFIIFGGYPPYTIILNGDEVGPLTNNVEPGKYEAHLLDGNGCLAVLSLNLGLNSVQNVELSELIYPNPSEHGFFNIKMNTVNKVNATNLSGQQVFCDYDPYSGVLNLSENSSGVYFLNIEIDNQWIHIPVMIN